MFHARTLQQFVDEDNAKRRIAEIERQLACKPDAGLAAELLDYPAIWRKTAAELRAEQKNAYCKGRLEGTK